MGSSQRLAGPVFCARFLAVSISRFHSFVRVGQPWLIPVVRRMSDIRQLRLARWERIKQGGIWRFVLLRGVLGWGLTMGVIGVIFEHVSRKAEAFPWYSILGLFLVGGFVWGLIMWFVTMWSYSRALKSR